MSIATRLRSSAGFCRSQSTFGTTPNIAPPSRRNTPSLKIRTSKRPMRTSRQYGRRWRFATFVEPTATSSARCGARVESAIAPATTMHRLRRCRLGTQGSASLASRVTASSHPRWPASTGVAVGSITSHESEVRTRHPRRLVKTDRGPSQRYGLPQLNISSGRARTRDGSGRYRTTREDREFAKSGAKCGIEPSRSSRPGRTAYAKRTHARGEDLDRIVAARDRARRRAHHRRRNRRGQPPPARAELSERGRWDRHARCWKRDAACSRERVTNARSSGPRDRSADASRSAEVVDVASPRILRRCGGRVSGDRGSSDGGCSSSTNSRQTIGSNASSRGRDARDLTSRITRLPDGASCPTVGLALRSTPMPQHEAPTENWLERSRLRRPRGIGTRTVASRAPAAVEESDHAGYVLGAQLILGAREHREELPIRSSPSRPKSFESKMSRQIPHSQAPRIFEGTCSRFWPIEPGETAGRLRARDREDRGRATLLFCKETRFSTSTAELHHVIRYRGVRDAM